MVLLTLSVYRLVLFAKDFFPAKPLKSKKKSFPTHHVEIYLEDELRLRFPLPAIQIARSTVLSSRAF